MPQVSSLSLPNPDWVWSNRSTAHAAKERAWFGEDYTPFESFVTDLSGVRKSVIGVGTVDLPTKRSPSSSGPGAHTTWRLFDVLHVPDGPCNIIGTPEGWDYTFWLHSDMPSQGSIIDAHGRQIAYFKPDVRFYQVRLSGPPVGPAVGPSTLVEDNVHFVHAFWPKSEQQRWKAYRAAGSNPAPVVGEGEEPPLTAGEKQWMGKHYENEFKFLLPHGLKIHKDEDRDEGRAILRALMSHSDDEDVSMGEVGRDEELLDVDENDENDDGDDDNDDDDDDDDDDDEADPLSHVADYCFDEAELGFIEARYGNSAKFMFAFGLKFWKDEDCEEAQAIVRAFMDDD